MDKSKNNRIYIYAYILSFVILLGIFSLLVYKKNSKTLNKPEIVTNSWNEVAIIKDKLDSWDYIEVIEKIEQKWTWSIERDEKMKLVYSYLSYWNYFYKEKENSKKALDILNTLDNDAEVLYYKWYANEIIKNYNEALNYYNEWLSEKELKNEYKSLILNQIWHLYDLKWEFDKVFKYYDEAYKLDEKNAMALANLWRYYIRTKEFSKAYELLNKALEISINLPLKSEICFWLSSLELELNWLTPNIEKSIDYARQSIDYYPSYPMWYVALANWLFMKNDRSLDIEIEESLDKSIGLNPDWHDAYYLYALHEIDKSNYEKASEYIRKTMFATNKDMILMDWEREKIKTSLMYDSMLIGSLKNIDKNPNILMKLINITWKLSNYKILTQLKRPNYWIFVTLKDNKDFKDLIKSYKK